jgi:hypothetical protein
VSLLNLSEKVNEPGGDGLRKLALCTEMSPDGRLNLAQYFVAPHQSLLVRYQFTYSS